MKRRICAAPRCNTILSRYNDGSHCWSHTLDLGQIEQASRRLGMTTEKRRYVTAVMPERFLMGLAGTYSLSPEEAEHVREVAE